MTSKKDILRLANRIIEQYGDKAPAYATGQMMKSQEEKDSAAMNLWTAILIGIMQKSQEEKLSEKYSHPSENFSESERFPIEYEIIWSPNQIAVFVDPEDFHALSEDKREDMVHRVIREHEKEYKTNRDMKDLPLYFVNETNNDLIREYNKNRLLQYKN